MPSNWTKQAQFLDFKFLNSAGGDTVPGGGLAAVPAPLNTTAGYTQGMQTVRGDRMVLGALDAFALSNTAIGTLYSGIYMYVGSNSGATFTAIGRLAFWDTSVFSIATSAPNAADNLYQVTPAELQAGAGITPPIAGVFINTLTSGNFWWVQIGGKATMAFGAATGFVFAGTASGYAKNQGVYAGGYGNTTGAGFVTVITGTTFATTTAQVDQYITQNVGIAETTPAASTSSIVDMALKPFRL